MNSSAPFSRMPLGQLSLENLIQFGGHLLVDHPAIDAQHKAIFDLGVKAYEDWRDGGCLDVLRPAVEKLTNLMHAHFTYEELVLHEIDYGDLESHAAEHQEMRDELSLMHEHLRCFKRAHKSQGESVPASDEAVMRFILGLTVGHVAGSDMRYCCELAANRSNPADDFWRGGDAVAQRHLQAAQLAAARSGARLHARLEHRAGTRSAKPLT